MATYYVSKAGNDSWDGLSPDFRGGSTGPKITIEAALDIVSSIGDTVEIVDEGSYNEGDLQITERETTITHTASHLGRPKIYGTGLAANAGLRAFDTSEESAVYHGLEISNYTNQAIFKGATGAMKFEMTGCFVHDIPQVFSHAIAGDSSAKTAFNECVMYFNNAAAVAIMCEDNVTLRNCLITSSNGSTNILRSYESKTVTASFCTFINNTSISTTTPIVEIGKLINCIVDGGISRMAKYGAATDDHTYNLVYVASQDFQSQAGVNTSPAASDITEQNPLFIDSTATGDSPSIAANFKLQSTSPCIDAGTSYDNITTDISGAGRAQQYWSSYSTPTEPKFAGDFTINLYNNIGVQYKRPLSPGANDMGAYEYVDPTADIYEGTYPAVDQVPFSLGPKGPGSLRGKPGAYGVSKGGDPSILIQTSSA
jgi:hypothetical protein